MPWTTILFAVFSIIAFPAYSRPGSADAYEAAAGYKDDIIAAFRLSVAAREAVDYGFRPMDWMFRINGNITKGNGRALTEYREDVTDKRQFDLLINRIQCETSQWYVAAMDGAAEAAESTSSCLDLHRQTDLFQLLDFDAARN